MVQPSSRDAGSQQPGKGNIVTGVDAVPVTLARRPPEGLDNKLPNPGLPRANLSVDAEHPDGTYAPPNMTVLQQHVAFWDPDRDGVIWPGDTYRGFRKLGFNPLLSFIAIPVIHGTFSWWSCPSWIPDPFLRIWMQNIHKAKHGSDSETYDTEGRFVPEKFEEVFSKYDKDGKGGLTLKEVNDMVCGNRNIMDPVGWTAEWLEWNTTFYLAAKDTPQGRILTKDDARGAIDGTLFYRVAREVEAGRLRKRQLHAGLEKTAPTVRKEE